MLKRAATVIWWLGALCFAAGAIGTVTGRDIGHRFAILAIGAVPALACFTLCYILAGTFRNPPTGPLSRLPHP